MSRKFSHSKYTSPLENRSATNTDLSSEICFLVTFFKTIFRWELIETGKKFQNECFFFAFSFARLLVA